METEKMIKDDANCSFFIETPYLRIQACDVDEDGNVQNVDFIKAGKLEMCFNMNDPEHCKSAIEYLLKTLWRVKD